MTKRYFWALVTPGRGIHEDSNQPNVFRYTDYEAAHYEKRGSYHNVIFKWKPRNDLPFQARAWAPTPMDALPELALLLDAKQEVRPQ